MIFRSECHPPKAPFVLNPEKPAVLIGSCFSQNIAERMNRHGWKALNPASTLYNPLSIAMAIEMFTAGDSGLRQFEDSLFFFNNLWHSRYFDSSFSSSRREDCIEEFKIRSRQFMSALSEGGILIVTFGTSICYFLNEGGKVVGNCHKQPSSLFSRRRIHPEEIIATWQSLISGLKEKWPALRIVFTVSPVRHLKDGLHGNMLSKATLLLAEEQICNDIPECFYFPAFEIVNDDLRDYRFYASDLVHPSEQAIEYIWEKFIETFTDEPGKVFLANGLKEWKALNHRPVVGALGRPLH